MPHLPFCDAPFTNVVYYGVLSFCDLAFPSRWTCGGHALLPRPPRPHAQVKKMNKDPSPSSGQQPGADGMPGGGMPGGGMPGGGMPGGMPSMGGAGAGGVDIGSILSGLGSMGGSGGAPGGAGGASGFDIGSILGAMGGAGGAAGPGAPGGGGGMGGMSDMLGKVMNNPKAMEAFQKAQSNPKVSQL